jgi:hypothetical protein
MTQLPKEVKILSLDDPVALHNALAECLGERTFSVTTRKVIVHHRKVIVHHVHPPIPTRRFDFCAYFDGEEEHYGWGETEAEAIWDLIEEAFP